MIINYIFEKEILRKKLYKGDIYLQWQKTDNLVWILFEFQRLFNCTVNWYTTNYIINFLPIFPSASERVVLLSKKKVKGLCLIMIMLMITNNFILFLDSNVPFQTVHSSYFFWSLLFLLNTLKGIAENIVYTFLSHILCTSWLGRFLSHTQKWWIMMGGKQIKVICKELKAIYFLDPKKQYICNCQYSSKQMCKLMNSLRWFDSHGLLIISWLRNELI